MRKLAFVLALILATATLAAAQAPKVVSGNMVLETNAAHAGSTVKAAVVAAVASGYHVNDHVPSLDYLIPTNLKLEPAAPLSVGATSYPKGSPQKFSFLDTPISVYQGKLVVGAQINVAADARPGTYTLKGSLDYQACNDRACLPPTSLPLTLSVKVVARGQALKPVNADVFHGLKFN
jgi:thioredoxin:protein disulfide reductase